MHALQLGLLLLIQRSTAVSALILFSSRDDALVARRFFCEICSSTAVAFLLPVAPSNALPPAGRNTANNSSQPTRRPSSIDYKAVAADIAALIHRVPYRGPPLIRLAWHASGTFAPAASSCHKGGSQGGTLRFDEELHHEANAGLKQSAVKILEPIEEKCGQHLSHADLHTLAGVVAMHALGGPSIDWSYGRIDAPDSSFVPTEGRLPSPDSGRSGADQADANHLRAIFGRMGFNDQDIVVLSGAHAVGRCNSWASGYDGTWTANPIVFDNSYFVNLIELQWKKRDWNGPLQYTSSEKVESKDKAKNKLSRQLMMLPTDLILLQDPSFRRYVKQYAKDRERFERDFSKAFQKLVELGTKDLIPANLWSPEKASRL